MRREGYISGLFVSICLAVVSSLSWAINPIADLIDRVAWPDYQPDQSELVTLGFIDPPREAPENWRKFRAFMARASNHRDFYGGQFY